MNWINVNLDKQLAVVILVTTALVGCTGFNKTDVQIHTAKSDTRTLSVFGKVEEFQGDWRDENTIVSHVLGEPDNLHPLNGSSAFGRILSLYLHGYLIVPEPSSANGLGPGLIKSMPQVSKHGLVYTYKLRDEIIWDDNSKLTVEDVIFSYKATLCPLVNNPQYKAYARAVSAIEKDSVESHTFHMKMSERNVQNIGIPTLFPILQESVWDKQNLLREYSFDELQVDAEELDEDKKLRAWATSINDWSIGRAPSKIVGLGPYQLSEWKHDQSITINLKSNHWSENISDSRIFDSGLPETIVFKFNRDPNSQALEFKSQTYDASSVVSRETYNALINNESFARNFNYTEISSYRYSYLAFNLMPNRVEHKSLFTDVKVRRAIANAVPYEQINHLVYGGKASRQVGPVSPLKEEFNHTLMPIETNAEESKRLLLEAGWIDTDGDNILDKTVDGQRMPFKFTLNYTIAPKHQELIAELIAESLYEVGIECQLHPVTFALLGEKKRSHNFDAFLSAWDMSASPQDFTQIWHTDSWINKGSNYVGFGSNSSDILIDSIRATVDITERNRMSKAFQQLVYDEQPYVFLFSDSKRIIAHKRFENVQAYNDRPHIIFNQWKLLENSVAAFDE